MILLAFMSYACYVKYIFTLPYQFYLRIIVVRATRSY